jgi:GntR family phosphonate transport system transcriptional regulator
MEEAIVRKAGITRWKQIQESLTEDIFAGKLSGKLPNETVLADRFHVNRHTVRQAVKALAEEGIVEVMHGRGTFVRDDVIDYKVGRRTRLAHSVTTARRVGKSQLLSWSTIRVTPEIAGMLSLPARAKVLQVDSLDIVDDKVIGVCTQYFPLPRFEGFGETYEKTGKTHLALANYGIHQFQRKLSRISARLPSAEVAQQLAQPVSLPILYVETVYVDESGQPIEYGISRFSSNAVQLVIEPD